MSVAPAIPRSIWISRIALGLAITLVVARATMTEMLRDPFQVQPGTQSAPRGLGASGSVVLDLLMCLPAILVLVRSSADRAYMISFSRVHFYGFALAAWIVISTFWATDRFAAAVESTHWGAAIVLMWAVSQLVDTWTRFPPHRRRLLRRAIDSYGARHHLSLRRCARATAEFRAKRSADLPRPRLGARFLHRQTVQTQGDERRSDWFQRFTQHICDDARAIGPCRCGPGGAAP